MDDKSEDEDFDFGMPMPQDMGQSMGDGMPQEDEAALDSMGGNEDDGQEEANDSEIMDIVNGLSLEDQAAVKKYAQSLQKDSTPQEPNEDANFNGMPTEGRKRLQRMVQETLGDVMDTDSSEERPTRELPKAYKKDRRNPFIFK